MNDHTSSRAASSSRDAKTRGIPRSTDPQQVAQAQREVLDQMSQRGRHGDGDGDGAQARESEEHEWPDAHLPAGQTRDAFRIDEDLTDLQPRHERRRHPSAVALEELDQVEVSPDSNDQL